ncbi:YjbQ family protein [Streptococcus hongkongensis]|nr:secondary thiamine-phosphate synthase [Streptococcus uberis]
MSVFQKTFSLETVANRDSYFNITEDVARAIQESKIDNGICLISTPHTTCSIFFEEWTHDQDSNGDDFLNLDLSVGLEKLFAPHDSTDVYHYPGEEHYKAVESWPNPERWLPNGDRKALWNADAHLKATLIGSSETIPLVGNQLAVGKTGYVYFVDFDRTRQRTRKVNVTIIGD